MSKPDLNSLSIKMKQINLLKERFSHTIEVVKDSTFKIPFLNVHLLISLPVNFPNSPPAYFLEILQTHQPVSLPQNYQWTQMSNLASVTVHIMEPFIKDSRILESLIDQVRRLQAQQQQSQPQRNVQQTQQQSQSQYSPPPPYKDQPISTSPNNKQPIQNKQQQQQQSQPNQNQNKIPSLPTEFSELKSKSIQELEELIKNEDSLNAFIYSFDEVGELSDRKSKLLSENERLTKITDPLPTEISDLEANISIVKQQFEQLKGKQDQLLYKKNEIAERYSQNSLLDKLNDSIAEYESESENIISNFLDGNLDIKEFKKQFKEKRSLFHSKSANKDLFFK